MYHTLYTCNISYVEHVRACLAQGRGNNNNNNNNNSTTTTTNNNNKHNKDNTSNTTNSNNNRHSNRNNRNYRNNNNNTHTGLVQGRGLPVAGRAEVGLGGTTLFSFFSLLFFSRTLARKTSEVNRSDPYPYISPSALGPVASSHNIALLRLLRDDAVFLLKHLDGRSLTRLT